MPSLELVYDHNVDLPNQVCINNVVLHKIYRQLDNLNVHADIVVFGNAVRPSHLGKHIFHFLSVQHHVGIRLGRCNVHARAYLIF